MENVPDAPEPVVDRYWVRSRTINNRWLGAEQHRERRFSYGARDWGGHSPWVFIAFAVFESTAWTHAVTSDPRTVPVAMVRDGQGGHKRKARPLRPPTVIAGHGAPFDRGSMSLEEMCELQGLPRDFAAEMPFTAHGKRKVIGNGVPLPMGRAIARAVRQALGLPLLEATA